MPGDVSSVVAGLAVFQVNKAQPLARPESIWLALGTVFMLLGMVYFLIKGWGVQDTEAREYYVITILIPAIAAASYLSMFLGFGLTEVTLTTGQTLDIYWARYADWLFTTPLLLLDLTLLADADTPDIIALTGLDGFMIVTGLVGALTTVYIFRFVWWTVSEIALLFILYYLFTILTTKARQMDDERQSTFLTLRNLTLILWFIYPIWWLIGTEGARIVSLFVETLGFMVLDVSAKVGFGFILLRSRAIFGESSDQSSSAATGTDATGPSGDSSQRVAKFELYEDQGGEWRYRLRTINGRTIASSSEGYDSKRNAREAIDHVQQYIEAAEYLYPDPTAFETYQDQADDWRWRLIHRNGNILADSGEGYASRSSANNAIDRIQTGVDEMSFDIYEDNAGEYRWRLLAGNNRVMADSGEGYTRRSNAEKAVDRVRDYVGDADQIEIGQAAFEIYADEGGEYRWRLRHRNGNILAITRRGFGGRRQVREAIKTVKRTAPEAERIVED